MHCCANHNFKLSSVSWRHQFIFHRCLHCGQNFKTKKWVAYDIWKEPGQGTVNASAQGWEKSERVLIALLYSFQPLPILPVSSFIYPSIFSHTYQNPTGSNTLISPIILSLGCIAHPHLILSLPMILSPLFISSLIYYPNHLVPTALKGSLCFLLVSPLKYNLSKNSEGWTSEEEWILVWPINAEFFMKGSGKNSLLTVHPSALDDFGWKVS